MARVQRNKPMRRVDLFVAIVVLVLSAPTSGTSGTQSARGTSGASTEWTHYSGNAASHKYSPLDQINKDNVGKLSIAWRWSSPDNAVVEANPTARPGGYADTPLMITVQSGTATYARAA